MIKKLSRLFWLGFSISILLGVSWLGLILAFAYSSNPYDTEPVDLFFSLSYQLTLGQIIMCLCAFLYYAFRKTDIPPPQADQKASTKLFHGFWVGCVILILNPFMYCEENCGTSCYSILPLGLQLTGPQSSCVNRRWIIFSSLLPTIEDMRSDLGQVPDKYQLKQSAKEYWEGDFTALWQDPWGGNIRFSSTENDFTLTSPGIDGEIGTNDDIFYNYKEAVAGKWTPTLFLREIFDIDNSHLQKNRRQKL